MSQSKEDELINYTIHKIIKYNPSKRYPNLVRENESKIIRSIKENHRIQFLDVLNKRDYYINKLNKLLNDSIKDGDNNEDLAMFLTKQFSKDEEKEEKEVNEEQVSNQVPHETTNKGLDPRYITNKYHAKQYIIENVVTNEIKTGKIKSLIIKHFKFQKELEAQRASIILKYKELMNNITIKNKLSKLSNTNLNIAENQKNQLNEKLTKELNKFDNEILFKMKKLSMESSNLLKQLNLPFFNISDSFKYPNLENDKVYLINLLIELLGPKDNEY